MRRKIVIRRSETERLTDTSAVKRIYEQGIHFLIVVTAKSERHFIIISISERTHEEGNLFPVVVRVKEVLSLESINQTLNFGEPFYTPFSHVLFFCQCTQSKDLHSPCR